jgi:hypothetical protein
MSHGESHYCPGCSAREKFIRVLMDAAGLLTPIGRVGTGLRGLKDLYEGMEHDPNLGPYFPTQRQSPLEHALAKPKRKVGRYQKEFGKILKKLKAAHPRTAKSTLMKRAHSQTKALQRKGGW